MDTAVKVWICGTILAIFMIPFMTEIGMEGNEIMGWILLWPLGLIGKTLMAAINIITKHHER